MRKTDKEIMREVFGKGSRWIGWNNWLKHQPVFEFIERKVEEGVSVMSTKHFFVLGKDTRPMDAPYVNIDHRTGELKCVSFHGEAAHNVLTVNTHGSLFTDGEKHIQLNDIFEDPWRPTEDELDLFQVLYGDEQLLIDLNREFYAGVLKLNKAVLRGEAKIAFMNQ